MSADRERAVEISNIEIVGYAQTIQLRSYRVRPLALPATPEPIILYFHGGGFTQGKLDDAELAARAISARTPAWVLSVAYSLAPAFPFPAALEDGYRAAQWAVDHATAYGADPRRIGVAGHDAGGNLATCLAAVVRDREAWGFSAQALLAPLLDPSMTRMADERYVVDADLDRNACARCYRAYLPNVSMRLHPYAAPLESRRLAGLPPALIASAEHDLLHVEAEKYASELIAAGVPTEVTRHANASHNALAGHDAALDDVVSFFRKRLGTTSVRE